VLPGQKKNRGGRQLTADPPRFIRLPGYASSLGADVEEALGVGAVGLGSFDYDGGFVFHVSYSPMCFIVLAYGPSRGGYLERDAGGFGADVEEALGVGTVGLGSFYDDGGFVFHVICSPGLVLL